MAEDSTERLQKVLAHAGVASRRKSEDLIVQGRVSVNGREVTQLGTKVDPGRDEIRVDGQRIKIAARHVYIMLNKSRGMLATMEDDRGRPDLATCFGSSPDLPRRSFGFRSQGLILLTNDGELANLLTHPRYKHEKEYRVLVNGSLSNKTRESWERGVILKGQPQLLQSSMCCARTRTVPCCVSSCTRVASAKSAAWPRCSDIRCGS